LARIVYYLSSERTLAPLTFELGNPLRGATDEKSCYKLGILDQSKPRSRRLVDDFAARNHCDDLDGSARAFVGVAPKT
jgi:hypothetical protein